MRLKSWSSGSLIVDFQIEILKHVIIFKIDVAENVEDGQRLTGKIKTRLQCNCSTNMYSYECLGRYLPS